MLLFIYSLFISNAMAQNLCSDGWYSDSSGRGTCSHHGGIMGSGVGPYIPVYLPPIQTVIISDTKTVEEAVLEATVETLPDKVVKVESSTLAQSEPIIASSFYAKYKGFIEEEACVGWISSGGLQHCWDVYEGKMLHTRMTCSNPTGGCRNTSGDDPSEEAMDAIAEEWRKLTKPDSSDSSKIESK